MDALKAVAALALALAPVPATAQPAADPVARWRPLIGEAAARFALPADWIERVMRAESAGLTAMNGRPIRSRVGAIGLMQLMPQTWSAMRSALGLGSNADDPHDNILAGAAYLRLMYDRFGYPGLFAAYNAGPGRYAAYLNGGSTLPNETIGYLSAVTGRARAVAIVPATPPRQLLFALRRDLADAPTRTAERRSPDTLFAIQRTAP